MLHDQEDHLITMIRDVHINHPPMERDILITIILTLTGLLIMNPTVDFTITADKNINHTFVSSTICVPTNTAIERDNPNKTTKKYSVGHTNTPFVHSDHRHIGINNI